jgi:hypothetical protein
MYRVDLEAFFGNVQELESGRVHMFHFVVLPWRLVYSSGHDSRLF